MTSIEFSVLLMLDQLAVQEETAIKIRVSEAVMAMAGLRG
jgi:hypothetical protein